MSNLYPLVSMQSPADIVSPDMSGGQLPARFLAQMMTVLPAGEIVDSMAVELLDSRTADCQFGPVPTKVSARALMSRVDAPGPGRRRNHGPARAALVAGATLEPTVQEVAASSMERGAVADDIWSVLCNPLTADLDATVRLPREGRLLETRALAGTWMCAVAGAALDGRETPAPRTPLFSKRRDLSYGEMLERHWPWGSLTQEQRDSVTAVSRELAGEWRHAAGEPLEKRSPLQSALDALTGRQREVPCSPAAIMAENLDEVLYSSEVSESARRLADLQADPAEVLEVLKPSPYREYLVHSGVQSPEPKTGVGQLNSWIPAVLDADSLAWRTLLREEWKPTAGRHVGTRLYEVTGDDPGLWSVALDLLEGWDRPLPEWLDAVAALK